jgi:hypothetical protein
MSNEKFKERSIIAIGKKKCVKDRNLPSGSSGTKRKIAQLVSKYGVELAFLDPVITSAQLFDSYSQVCIACFISTSTNQ